MFGFVEFDARQNELQRLQGQSDGSPTRSALLEFLAQTALQGKAELAQDTQNGTVVLVRRILLCFYEFVHVLSFTPSSLLRLF